MSNAEELIDYIQRVERLNDEISELQVDVREVYKEAKGRGFDTKAMREIVKLRKMMNADRAEFEYLRQEYKKLLGLED